jgi:hypothetical protein
MQKAIEAAKKISKSIDLDSRPILEDFNLHKTFDAIFSPSLAYDTVTANTIVCFIIYAYDNQSTWIEINSDRLSDKKKILVGLGADISKSPYVEVLSQSVSEVKEVIFEYLKTIINWKWRTIMISLDVHQQSLQAIGDPIKSTDELEIEKIKKERYANLREGGRNREICDNLLKEIQSEYVKSDRATQQDFGFDMTQEKTIDPMSWRQHIDILNEKKKAAN